MRMLLRASFSAEAGNAGAKAGILGSTLDRILAELKPEAAYFFLDTMTANGPPPLCST